MLHTLGPLETQLDGEKAMAELIDSQVTAFWGRFDSEIDEFNRRQNSSLQGIESFLFEVCIAFVPCSLIACGLNLGPLMKQKVPEGVSLVYTERAEPAAISCGTSHASSGSTPLRWIFKKRAMKRWSCTRVESVASGVNLLESGE